MEENEFVASGNPEDFKIINIYARNNIIDASIFIPFKHKYIKTAVVQ